MRQTILDISDAKGVFNSILSHWNNANQALGGSGIVLKGNFDRKAFLNAAVEFDHLGEVIDSAVKQRDRASEQLSLYKENMRATMQRFGYLVRGLYPGSDFESALPALPDVRTNEDKFMAPVERMLKVWTRINMTSTLVLPDGTTLEAFKQGVEVLRQAFRQREKAFQVDRQVRSQRRQNHQGLIDRAVQYRAVVLGTFGEESVLSETLPYLWPKQERRKKAPQRLEIVTPGETTNPTMAALPA
jgi:hypothetical protein